MTRLLAELAFGVLGCALVAGCGSSREVEVTGEVTAPSTLNVAGPIQLDLYDVEGSEEDAPEFTHVHSATLEGLGAFSETADFSGENVLIRAIDDRDGDGACSAGEAWGEVQVAIGSDDKTSAALIALRAAPCPTGE